MTICTEWESGFRETAFGIFINGYPNSSTERRVTIYALFLFLVVLGMCGVGLLFTGVADTNTTRVIWGIFLLAAVSITCCTIHATYLAFKRGLYMGVSAMEYSASESDSYEISGISSETESGIYDYTDLVFQEDVSDDTDSLQSSSLYASRPFHQACAENLSDRGDIPDAPANTTTGTLVNTSTDDTHRDHRLIRRLSRSLSVDNIAFVQGGIFSKRSQSCKVVC